MSRSGFTPSGAVPPNVPANLRELLQERLKSYLGGAGRRGTAFLTEAVAVITELVEGMGESDPEFVLRHSRARLAQLAALNAIQLEEATKEAVIGAILDVVRVAVLALPGPALPVAEAAVSVAETATTPGFKFKTRPT